MRIIKGRKRELDRKVVEIISKKFKRKGRVVFGIPGGRSVKGIFRKLRGAEVDWRKVQIFWVDERCVSLRSKDSNFREANDLFISFLIKEGKLPRENVHAFDYKKGVGSYAREFEKFGGKFDFVLLGMGDDCHVASLFPEHKEKGWKFVIVKDSPKLPRERMSVSRNVLERAGSGMLLIYGEGKREAYDRFRDGKVSVKTCPAKLLKRIRDFYLFTDLD